jgi:hypothetical protein
MPVIAKDLSKNESIAILENTMAALGCSSEIDLRHLIKKTKELLCADYCICGFAEIDANGVWGVTSMINGDYPEEWLDLYMAKRFFKKDPIVRFHGKYCTTQLWKDTFMLYEDEAQWQLINSANEFGLKYGVSGGLFEPEISNASIFSFASTKNVFNEHHKKIVDALMLPLP